MIILPECPQAELEVIQIAAAATVCICKELPTEFNGNSFAKQK